MKFLYKSWIILFLVIIFITGCTPTSKQEPLKDKYRSYYQIWVGSFCDSNNDGVGDIKGIISKLDYLTDLGIDGIWLSPIMPSPSYHKYNVTDYYNIDPEFGTLEDFDKFMTECKARGINVILDLVLNHISSEHEWFKKACEEVKAGNFDGYAKYFEFIKSETVPHGGYRLVEGSQDLWYEGNFTHEMPEWNLDSTETRDEFIKISKFWLDRGVSGFRLDALKYFTNDHTDGKEFLKWYYAEGQKLNPEFYIVGENWDSNNKIYDLYESQIDSQFAFKFAGNADGSFAVAANVENNSQMLISKVNTFINSTKERNPNVINGWFLSNHDTVRIANYLKDTSNMKMAAALYMLLPGNSFTYYGEEIGILAPNTSTDLSYRTPMEWENLNEENPNSLLNFYKQIYKIKTENPEIARGVMTQATEFDDKSIGAFYVDYNNSKLLIIHNTSLKETKELTLTEKMNIKDSLIAIDKDSTEKAEITLKDKTLTMPPQSTVILKV